MSRLRLALTLVLAAAACLPIAAQAQADKATVNAIEGYFVGPAKRPRPA